MNEALLGGSLCPPSEFQTFWSRNFGRFACRCRNFVQSHFFHTPKPRIPYPGTPSLRFPPSRSCYDFTGSFAQIFREKKNFCYFIWFAQNMQIRKRLERSMAAYNVFVVTVLAISASKQVEWFYRVVQRATKVTFNKLTSVFYASVLLLIMNFVITLSK